MGAELTFRDVLAAQLDALQAPAPRACPRACNTCGRTFASRGRAMCEACYAAQPDPFAEFDAEPTAAIPVQSMREMVFGGRALAALVLVLSVAVGACQATAPARVELETVGALAPSYNSVATTPVHATTDFGHAQVVGGADDDDAAPVAFDGGGAAVAPDVTAKGGGLRAGEVR